MHKHLKAAAKHTAHAKKLLKKAKGHQAKAVAEAKVAKD